MNKVKKDSKTTFLSRLSEMLSYNICLFFILLISYLPFRVLYVISDIFYFPLYYLIRYRRKIVRRNLRESFPEKSLEEIIKIEKKFYHFFIDIFLETFKLLTISDEELKKHLEFTHLDVLLDMFKKEKSIAFYLGHYGNWEWVSTLGVWVKNYTLAQIYRKLNNKAIDKIMLKLRQRKGSICVEMHEAVRFMANLSSKKEVCALGFLSDQSPKRKDSNYFIPFLEHQTPVITASEKAAKHFNYAAIFVYVKRIKRGSYQCEILPLTYDSKDLKDFELTRLYFKALEKEIREVPELYLWTHNRFKYAIKQE